MRKLNTDATTIASIGVISTITQRVIKNLDGQGLNIYGDETKDNQDIVLTRLITARLYNVLKSKRGDK